MLTNGTVKWNVGLCAGGYKIPSSWHNDSIVLSRNGLHNAPVARGPLHFSVSGFVMWNCWRENCLISVWHRYPNMLADVLFLYWLPCRLESQSIGPAILFTDRVYVLGVLWQGLFCSHEYTSPWLLSWMSFRPPWLVRTIFLEKVENLLISSRKW